MTYRQLTLLSLILCCAILSSCKPKEHEPNADTQAPAIETTDNKPANSPPKKPTATPQAKALDAEYQDDVNHLKKILQERDKQALAKLIHYPIERGYPIPSIENSDEFIKHYDHFIDNDFIDKILNSSTQYDWSEQGWRGVVGPSMSLGEDGMILVLDYRTKKGKAYEKKIRDNARKTLHPSLQNFIKPSAYIETKKFKIRIDDMGETPGYRYAAWPIDKSMAEKPDLILQNGTMTMEGSVGNHTYTFINGQYKYKVDIYIIGCDDTPPADLIVYKDDKTILVENAVKRELNR